MSDEVYKIYLKYNFLDISLADVEKMILDIAEKDNIVRDLDIKLHDMVCELLGNNNHAVYIISNYIDKKLMETKDYGNALNNINILLDYFGGYDFVFNPEIIIKLINKSKRLNSFLKIVVLHDKDKLNKIVNDGVLGLMIDIYCNINNIAIGDSKKEGNIDHEVELSSSYRMYIREIKQFSVLGYDEVNQLFKRYRLGDKQAKDELITHNLKLVSHIANDYMDVGIPLVDLIQEGNIGLITAVEKFDVGKGFKFSTYAKWWIRQAIVRYIANNSRLIRIPGYLHEKNMKFLKAVAKLSKELGREPMDEEIAEEMNVNVSWVNYMRSIFRSTLSMDLTVSGDDDTKIGDTIQADCDVEEEATFDDLADRIMQLMDDCKLTKREKKVLKYRFGFGGCRIKTLEELAKEEGVTREAIRLRERRALDKIKNSSYIREFVLYMDNPDYYYDSDGKFDRSKLVEEPSADKIYRLGIRRNVLK